MPPVQHTSGPVLMGQAGVALRGASTQAGCHAAGREHGPGRGHSPRARPGQKCRNCSVAGGSVMARGAVRAGLEQW